MSERTGVRGKWVAATLVGLAVIAAVVGYLVRPLKPRPAATTTQPVVVQTAPAER